MGRPRVSPNSVQMKLTLSQDDLDLLNAICVFTGSRPATMMRELLQESRPTFEAMLEAFEAHECGKEPAAGSLASKMLKMALTGKEPSQSDIFEMLEEKKK